MAKTTRGYIYVVTNPAIKGWRKVGMTTNPERRLASYQTADPFRSYRFDFLCPVKDARESERLLLEGLEEKGYLPKGEWTQAPLRTIKALIRKIEKE